MLQKKLVKIAAKCVYQEGRLFTSKPQNAYSTSKSMLKFWDFTLVMITIRHCLEKRMSNGWKGSNSEKISERLLFKFVPEAQGRTTEFKTLVWNVCKNATIELRSGNLYEPAILPVHKALKRRSKTKDVEKIQQNFPDQS